MFSPLSNNRYGFNPSSNTHQQPSIQWKDGVYYGQYPTRQKNGQYISPKPTTQLYLNAMPLKIYRKELNAVSPIVSNSSISIAGNMEQPGGVFYSQTVPNQQQHIFMNSTHKNDSCDSFSLGGGGLNTCQSTAGNALNRVRNRNMSIVSQTYKYNSSSTKNIDSLVVPINNRRI
jgi:hypothetical protein